MFYFLPRTDIREG